MLRRRDLRNDENGAEQATAEGAAVELGADGGAGVQAQAVQPNANISPGGLAWKPMRQTNEEWRPRQSAGAPDGSESIVGAEDFFNGAYRSERGVRVQGRVEGSIESQKHILIEEDAQVSADMTAEDITVAGRYNGKVNCRRRFEITPTGVVTGEINTDLLVVQEGGYFDGKLKMKERGGAARATSGAPGRQPRSEAIQSADAVVASPMSPDEDQAPAQV